MDRYYRTLGLERGAAEDDVKRAYRKRALQLHPDRNPNGAEAFKALQDAYEAALADVKRRGAGSYGASAFSFPTSSGSTGAAAAAAAAGPGYRFARTANGAAHSSATAEASAPLFTEAELFGDAIPGGWRGGTGGGGGGGASRATAGRAAPTQGHAGSSAGSPEAAEADARWRRAHGSRVPVSAYEGTGPLPPRAPPPPASSPQPTPAAASAPRRFPQQPHAPPTSASTASQETEAEETAEDRAYREAMFLLRRMQDMASRDSDPTTAPHAKPTRQPTTGPQPASTTTEAAAGEKPATDAERKAELHRQWKSMDATLRRKLGKSGADASGASSTSSSTSSQPPPPPQGPSGAHAAGGNGADARAGAQANANTASGAASRSGPSLGETWREVRQAHDQAHREALLDERRLLQRQYMRYRYCPNPAEVGEMSDMEVFLLTSLMEEMQQRMRGVLDARLCKGPCSTCKEAARAQAHRYFTCTHPSVCEGCYAAGVLKCPLCGAARATAQSSDDAAPSSATRGGAASTPLSGAPPPTSSAASQASASEDTSTAAAAGAAVDTNCAPSAAAAPCHEPAVASPRSQMHPSDGVEVSPVSS